MYYDFSLKGFRQYLDKDLLPNINDADADNDQKKIYQQLNQKLVGLERQRTTAVVASTATATLGLVLCVGALSFLQHDRINYFGETEKETNYVAYGAGTLLFFGAWGVYYILGGSPGREELLDFINEHNRLRYQLGLLPSHQNGQNSYQYFAQLTYDF